MEDDLKTKQKNGRQPQKKCKNGRRPQENEIQTQIKWMEGNLKKNGRRTNQPKST